jgi:hypothetical protein
MSYLIDASIALVTTVVGGLILMAKGERFLHLMKKLPDRRRISYFTNVYLRGLRYYPYEFIYHIALIIVPGLLFFLLFAFIEMTYTSFRLAYGSQTLEEINKLKHSFFENIVSHPVFPWLDAGLTVAIAFLIFRIYQKKIIGGARANGVPRLPANTRLRCKSRDEKTVPRLPQCRRECRRHRRIAQAS